MTCTATRTATSGIRRTAAHMWACWIPTPVSSRNTGFPTKRKPRPGRCPGTHRVWIDNEGLVWISEGWTSRLTALDPRNGQVVHRFDQRTPEGQRVFQANFAMDAEGYAYTTRGQRGGRRQGCGQDRRQDGRSGAAVSARDSHDVQLRSTPSMTPPASPAICSSGESAGHSDRR